MRAQADMLKETADRLIEQARTIGDPTAAEAEVAAARAAGEQRAVTAEAGRAAAEEVAAAAKQRADEADDATYVMGKRLEAHAAELARLTATADRERQAAERERQILDDRVREITSGASIGNETSNVER
jgi:colicin import membrane protein